MKHPHGTANGYRVDGCRCARCRAAHAKAIQAYRLAIEEGTHRPDVAAGPVREHVNDLRAAGMKVASIAGRAGVSVGMLNDLLYGKPSQGRPPTPKMRPGNADRLLAVQPGRRIEAGR